MTFSDNSMPSTLQNKLSSLASAHEVLTTAQLLDAGISDQSITRLVEKGTLVRVRRGIYEHANCPVSEHHDLIQVTKSASRAVIVLISTLKFHNIGTQQAYEVWIQLLRLSNVWLPHMGLGVRCLGIANLKGPKFYGKNVSSLYAV